MTGQTTHLGLPQWAEPDYVRMEEFNAAFLAIDDYTEDVTEEIRQAGNVLAQQIDTVNHNFVRSWIAQQLTNPVLGTTPTAAFVQHVDHAYALAHATGFPKYADDKIIGYPGGRPSIGLGSGRYAPNPQPDSFSFTISAPVALDQTYHHLTAALYFRGSEQDPAHLETAAFLDEYPNRSAYNITGATVSCAIPGTTVTFDKRIEDVWPIPVIIHSPVGGSDTVYELTVAEDIFHAHGDFSGTVNVVFTATCAATLTLRPYTIVVLMS